MPRVGYAVSGCAPTSEKPASCESTLSFPGSLGQDPNHQGSAVQFRRCLRFHAATSRICKSRPVILNGITGGVYGAQERTLVLVGWLAWQVAGRVMAHLSDAISEEAQAGTLEQVCLSPVPLAAVVAARSVAYLLTAGAEGVVAAVVLVFFAGPLPFGAGLLAVFCMSLVGAYGLGFLFAGLAMVFKRASSLTNLVFSLMIFFTGAFVGLERLGWAFTATRFLFPLTWGISLMRAMLAGDTSLLSLWRSEALIGLSLHSAVYLAAGLGVFAWGYHTARRKGTLGHY